MYQWALRSLLQDMNQPVNQSGRPSQAPEYLPDPPFPRPPIPRLLHLDAVITVADADNGPTEFHTGHPGRFDLNWYGWPPDLSLRTPITITARAVIDDVIDRDLGPIAVSVTGEMNLTDSTGNKELQVPIHRSAPDGNLRLDPMSFVTAEYPVPFNIGLTAIATASYGALLERQSVTTTVPIFGWVVAWS